MSSGQEKRGEEAEALAAEARAREAAREITHERTERARVVGEEEHRRADFLETAHQDHQGARSVVSAASGEHTDDTKAAWEHSA
uniref:Uncharacterized protein n=1 Tax=Oryza brachyantha TaxID=4533 RepID=J3MP96_ORYBR